MRLCICYCINCGAKYEWQASGSYEALDTPRELQDKDYCPECKGAINDALSKIEKKTKIDYQLTDEITLEQLLKEKSARLERQKGGLYMERIFPYMERIFPTLWSQERNEHQRAGVETINGREYFYSYWPSMAEPPKITVKVRVEIKTGKIIDYR